MSRQLQGLTREALLKLAQDNARDRQLLADIRSQFIRRGSQLEAQKITKLLLSLSSPTKKDSTEESVGVPEVGAKLSELQRYFRQVFSEVEGLTQLLKILEGRDGRASEELADEVRGRLRTLNPAPSPGKSQSSGPAVALSQREYEQLFVLCQQGNATPDQVQRLARELDRRGFGASHPVRQTVASPPQPGVRQAVAVPKETVRLAVPSYSTPLPSSVDLQKRRQEREERRRARIQESTPGFIQIRPVAERQMLEVHLGSPDNLIATVARMRRFVSRTPSYQGITEAQLQEAMERLRQQQWADEGQRRRDYRLIPYLLLAGNPPNVARYGVGVFLGELDTNNRLASVKELIQRYFQPEFRELPAQRVELGKWIQNRLRGVPPEKKRSLWLDHFCTHVDLFSTDPLEYARQFLPPTQSGWKEWEALDLPIQSWLYTDVLAAGIRIAVRTQDEPLREEFYRRLQRTVSHDAKGSNTQVVQKPVETFETRRKCIEAALLEYARQGSAPLDTPLIAFALDTLKDPRLKDSTLWLGVDQAARDLLQAWLSIEDLELFFGELADDADEKSRVQFWKPFVLNRMVTTSRIFLGEAVIRRKKTKVSKYMETGRYGKLFGKGKKDDEVCAFVLRIKDAIIVEFSKVNNACFIYDAKTFDPGLFSARTLDIAALKDASARKLPHVSGWTDKFQESLYLNYGIRRPGK